MQALYSILFGLNFAFYAVVSEILGMANSVDPDQTASLGAVWSASALFVYAILSDPLVYKILGHLPYPYFSF